MAEQAVTLRVEGSAEYDEPSVSGLLLMSRRWITANMPDYAAVDNAKIKYL